MKTPITIQTTVKADLQKTWNYWNEPQHIVNWAFASDDWEAPTAENDLRTGGQLKVRMSAKDKSAGFDFIGVYLIVEDKKRIEFDMTDKRHVQVLFEETPSGVKVTETFDPEEQNSEEMQREGWQAILNNFKKYVEEN